MFTKLKCDKVGFCSVLRRPTIVVYFDEMGIPSALLSFCKGIPSALLSFFKGIPSALLSFCKGITSEKPVSPGTRLRAFFHILMVFAHQCIGLQYNAASYGLVILQMNQTGSGNITLHMQSPSITKHKNEERGVCISLTISYDG